MGKNEPLVLKFLSLLKRVILILNSLVITLTWSPILLYQKLFHFLLDRFDTGISFFLFIPLRWAMVTFYYPLFPLYFGAMGYSLIWIHIDIYVVKMLFCGFLWSFLLYVVISGFALQKKFVMCSAADVAKVQHYMLGFLLGLLSCCLLTRSLRFLRMLKRERNKDAMIRNCFVYFVYSVFDLFSLPFVLAIVITLYRLNHSLRLIRKSPKFKNSPWLVWIIQTFNMIVFDVPSFLLCFPLCLITFYRLRSLIKEFRKENIDLRYKVCWKYFFNVFIDVPFFLFGIVVVCSVYRAPKVIKIISDKIEVRRRIFEQFVLVLLDVPFVLSLFLIYCFRFNPLRSYKRSYAEKSPIEGHIFTITLGLLVLVELILFVIVALPTFLLACWRIDFTGMKNEKFEERVKFYFYQWVYVVVDYYYIVQILLFMILCNWRCSFVFKKVKTLWNDNDTLWKFFEELRNSLIYQVGWFLLDVVCLPMIIVLVVSVYRLIEFYKSYKNGEEMETYHYFVMYQFKELLVDLPFIIMGILSCYRIIYIWRKFNKDNARENRKEAFEQFRRMIKDVPALVCLFFIIITLYRLFNLIRKLREKFKQEDIFLEFLELLKDLPYIVLGILSLWRIPVLLYRIYKIENVEERRNQSVKQFQYMILDTPCSIMSILILGTFFRAPTFLQKLKNEFTHTVIFNEFKEWMFDFPYMVLLLLSLWRMFIVIPKLLKNRNRTSQENRQEIVNEFKNFLLDIPSIICIIVILVTLYRVWNLIKRLRNNFVHETIFDEFGQVIYDSPYIFLGILSTWRMVLIFSRIIRNETALENREEALKQFKLFVLDIPAFLCLLVLLITGYRIPNLYRKMKNEFSHLMIFRELKEFLDDFPYLLVGLLSTWRVVFIIKRSFSNETARENREEALKQFKYFALDIPAFLSLVVLFIFGYRIPNLYRKMKNEFSHATIFKEFKEFVDDFPYLLVGLLSTWRIVFIIKRSFRYETARENREEALKQFGLFALDIPTFVCLIFLAVSGYRIPNMYRKLKIDFSHYVIMNEFVELVKDSPYLLMGFLSTWRMYFIFSKIFSSENASAVEIRKEAMAQFSLFLVDIPAFVTVLIVLGTVFRAYTLITRLKGEFSHRVIFEEFKEFIYDLPYIILGFFSLWRIPLVLPKFITNNEDRRNQSVEQFKKTVLDVPAFFCAAVVVIFMYRAFNLFKRFRENPVHLTIFKEFYELIVDIPYIVLGIASMWRIPLLVYKITKVEGAEKRRGLCREQVIETLKDIPFFISFCLLVLSEIHILTIVKYWSDENFRTIVMKTAVQLPLHTHYILMAYFITITLYRFPFLLKLIKNHPDKIPDVIKNQFLCIFLDILCVLSMCITLVTVIRMKELISVLKNDSLFVDTADFKTAMVAHRKILKIGWDLVLDIPVFMMFYISLITVWRYRRISKFYLENRDDKLVLYRGMLFYLLSTIYDPFFLLMYGIMYISYYRRASISSLFEKESLIEIYVSMSSEFFWYLVDLPIFFFYYFSCLSVWRNKRIAEYFDRNKGMRVNLYGMLFAVFLLTFVDIVFLPMIALMYITKWKTETLVVSQEFVLEGILKVYAVEMYEFFRLCFFSPVVILYLFSFLTIWRYHRISNYFQDNKNDVLKLYSYFIRVSLLTFYDPILFFMMGLLVVCPWRRKRVPVHFKKELFGIYVGITIEFVNLIIDLLVFVPLLIFTLMSVYRFVWFLKKMKKRKWTIQNFRIEVTFQFLQLLHDSPFLLVVIPYSLTLGIYRIVQSYKIFFVEKSNERRREKLNDMIQYLVVDMITFIVILILAVVFPWRLIAFVWGVIFNGKDFRKSSSENLREGFVDLITVFQLAVIVLSIDHVIRSAGVRIVRLLYYYVSNFSIRALFRHPPISEEDNGRTIENVYIPDEMFFEIFQFLPGEEVHKCMRTCKEWHNYIGKNEYLWYRINILDEKKIDQWGKILRTSFSNQRETFKLKYINRQGMVNRIVPDHKKGFKVVVSEEFRSALRKIPQMFFFPLRFFGLLLYCFSFLEKLFFGFLIVTPERFNLGRTDYEHIVREIRNGSNQYKNASWERKWDDLFAKHARAFLIDVGVVFLLETLTTVPHILFILLHIITFGAPLYIDGLPHIHVWYLLIWYNVIVCLVTSAMGIVVIVAFAILPFLLDIRALSFYPLHFILRQFVSPIGKCHYFLSSLSLPLQILFVQLRCVFGLWYGIVYIGKIVLSFLFQDTSLCYSIVFALLYAYVSAGNFYFTTELIRKHFKFYRPLQYLKEIFELMGLVITTIVNFAVRILTIIFKIIHKILSAIYFVLSLTVRKVVELVAVIFNLVYTNVILVFFRFLAKLFRAIGVMFVFIFRTLLVDYLYKGVIKFLNFIVALYGAILYQGTRICKSMGLIGELVMFPLVIVWIAWPFVVVYFLQIRLLYIIATILSSILTFRAIIVIRSAWNPK